MKVLRRDISGRSEEASGLGQGPSRPRGVKFDSEVSKLARLERKAKL